MRVTLERLEYSAIVILVLVLAARMTFFSGTTNWKTIAFRCVLVLMSLGVVALMSEVGLRLVMDRSFHTFDDERNLSYRYDATLGWFPVESSSNRVTACRTINVAHNSRGFREGELQPSEKPGVLFLGDSFVWGFDVETTERFTDKLQGVHPEWSIHNLGVSGYGTDQELLLLKQQFDTFRPRVVFLVFCTDNDQKDNCSNVRHGGYYKPYFTTNADGGLTLQGVPVPRSERAYYSGGLKQPGSFAVRMAVRAWSNLTNPAKVTVPDPTFALLSEMNRYATERGALFAVGLQTPHAQLETFLTEKGIPWIDLSNEKRYSAYGFHWTSEGHDIVAARIDGFLTQSNAPIAAALKHKTRQELSAR
jgi:hypothetical protein